MKVYISRGNTKLGAVLNISLPPVLACGKDVPCKKDCYALKAWKQYPATRIAWRGNYDAFLENHDDYFDAIANELKKSKIKLVRHHVAGDIINLAYLGGMMRLARELPNKNFLAFTKRYDLLAELDKIHIPNNLRFVLSAWPGLDIPDALMPRFGVAWMRDSENLDARIPKDAKECPGGCETCGLCWNLCGGQSVVFDKH